MKWLLRRLREPSTWRGLVWLATVAGLSLRPEQAEAIVAAGMALAGLLGVFLPDESKNVRIELPPIDLVAGKDRAVYRDGAVDEPGGVAADQLRQPVPSNRDPDADSQQNRWESSSFRDK
jgi:hypothetical protein